MAKVARGARGGALEKKIVRDFWSVFHKLDYKECAYLLGKILTPTEKLMVAKRLATLKELRRGSSYVAVNDKLRVVSNTIWRMNDLLQSSPRLSKIIGKIDTSSAETRGRRKRGRPKKRQGLERMREKPSRPRRGLSLKVRSKQSLLREANPQQIWFT